MITVIILNIKGLNTAIKKQMLSEWIKKEDQTIYSLQELSFRYKNTQI